MAIQPQNSQDKKVDSTSTRDFGTEFGTMDSDVKKNVSSPGKLDRADRADQDVETGQEFSADADEDDFDAQEMPSSPMSRPEQGRDSQVNQSKNPDLER